MREDGYIHSCDSESSWAIQAAGSPSPRPCSAGWRRRDPEALATCSMDRGPSRCLRYVHILSIRAPWLRVCTFRFSAGRTVGPVDGCHSFCARASCWAPFQRMLRNFHAYSAFICILKHSAAHADWGRDGADLVPLPGLRFSQFHLGAVSHGWAGAHIRVRNRLLSLPALIALEAQRPCLLLERSRGVCAGVYVSVVGPALACRSQPHKGFGDP